MCAKKTNVRQLSIPDFIRDLHKLKKIETGLVETIHKSSIRDIHSFTRAIYDEFSKVRSIDSDYDRHMKEHHQAAFFLIDALFERSSIQFPLVDPTCGTGKLLEYLCDRYISSPEERKQVFANDFSGGMIAQAGKRLARFSGIHFSQEDLLFLDQKKGRSELQDKKFKTIICCQTLNILDPKTRIEILKYFASALVKPRFPGDELSAGSLVLLEEYPWMLTPSASLGALYSLIKAISHPVGTPDKLDSLVETETGLEWVFTKECKIDAHHTLYMRVFRPLFQAD